MSDVKQYLEISYFLILFSHLCKLMDEETYEKEENTMMLLTDSLPAG